MYRSYAHDQRILKIGATHLSSCRKSNNNGGGGPYPRTRAAAAIDTTMTRHVRIIFWRAPLLRRAAFEP
jgi:hypothetical protein